MIDFLAFSPVNPSSIRMCLETGRANARAVRTALTAEMWEAINAGWLDLKRFDGSRMDRPALNDIPRPGEGSLPPLRRLGLPHHAAERRLFLLRGSASISSAPTTPPASSTSSIMCSCRSEASVGGGLDYFQWSSILRSVSALTAYRWVYRESLKPWLIADLLVLNEQMPRSLASCYANLATYLDELSQRLWAAGSRPSAPPARSAPGCRTPPSPISSRGRDCTNS